MLKPYMGHGGEPSDGAVLIFAHTVQEAKRVGWAKSSVLRDCSDGEYIYLRVTYLKDCDFLLKVANQEKLKADTPHVNENPTGCKSCELWGLELDKDGYCKDCAADRADQINSGHTAKGE